MLQENAEVYTFSLYSLTNLVDNIIILIKSNHRHYVAFKTPVNVNNRYEYINNSFDKGSMTSILFHLLADLFQNKVFKNVLLQV